MINTILIDSERKDLEQLQQSLQNNCPQINICGLATSLNEAAQLLQKLTPSLAFINAELSLDQSNAIFDTVSGLNLEAIFTSDTPDYSQKIFKYHVSGYLIKPLDSNELIEAVGIAEKRILEKQPKKEQYIEKKSPLSEIPSCKIIGIPTIDGLEFFSIDDIIRCEGYQNCTRIITTSRSDFISSYNIGVFRKLLEKHHFFSTHKSHLVNLSYIKKYYKEGTLQLTDLSVVPVSKRRKSIFLKLLTSTH